MFVGQLESLPPEFKFLSQPTTCKAVTAEAFTRNMIVTSSDFGSKIPTAVELENLAHLAIQSSPYRDIRRLRCELRSGVLTLQGQVNSYYHKQIAQEQLQSKLAGRCALENRIVVADH
jgi:hypothetical protein